jgi:hypothetical protein
MSESPRGEQAESDSKRRSGGVDFRGDATIAGDVAGRDVIKTETTVGFGAKAVQRLVLAVGALVFVATALAFTLGFVVASRVVPDLQRSVASSPQLAASLDAKLQEAQAAPSGETRNLEISEAELNSFVNREGGDFGLSNAEARFVESGLVAIGGNLDSLGGLEVAATFRLQENAGQIVALESAGVRLLPFEGSALGWAALPNFAVADFADRVNQKLGSGYVITSVWSGGESDWNVTVQGR